MKRLSAIIAPAFALLVCCAPEPSLVSEADFNDNIDGKQVSLYTIKGGDCIAQVTNFGARVVTLNVLNKDGKYTNVVLGHKTLDEYANFVGERFVGCCVGPVANRIAKGRFTIDDQEYELPLNNDQNTLHGGFKGIDQLVWDVISADESSITMKVVHPDGMEGFPGNTEIEVSYSIKAECNALVIGYKAVSDKKTPINLSHHAMFNVGGEAVENVEEQVMCINADYYTPVDETMIPTGEIRPVEGTPFDFRKPKKIGQDINAEDGQLAIGRGYDHNWCVNVSCAEESCGKTCCKGLNKMCWVWSPSTGICMEVLSDQCGIQFYSGNFFDGNGTGTNGRSFDLRHALALETQNYPDAVNQSEFPCSVYEPGQEYTQTCIYKFSVCDGNCDGDCECSCGDGCCHEK